jgi:hypothetical protein
LLPTVQVNSSSPALPASSVALNITSNRPESEQGHQHRIHFLILIIIIITIIIIICLHQVDPIL